MVAFPSPIVHSSILYADHQVGYMDSSGLLNRLNLFTDML